MATLENDLAMRDSSEQPDSATEQHSIHRPSTPSKTAPANGDAKLPATPTRKFDKPLPKEPAMTPRIKKKVPWKGKNIMVLLPRDDERGLPGKPPKPLRQDEIQKMFTSWKELGYSVDGFDLLVEGYLPPGADDSQSREAWPSSEDVIQERTEQSYKVTLPDLNAWKDYVNELQEAKLRALGVFTAEEEPPAPPSPPTTNPSRQPSAQHPALPFSPPLPTSSASSNQAAFNYPFPQQFNPSATQSPAIPSGASPIPFGAANGKFNPRQSVSFPASNSPFQMSPQLPQWPNMQGMDRSDSPSFANLNGLVSPQSPFGMDGINPTGSPAFNMHGRQQSLQYPVLPHQQLHHQQQMRASPRLQEVREDDEEGARSPSKTPEPHHKQNNDSLQAEIDDAEYHLEEQFRNQLEHEDYNPQAQGDEPMHVQQASGQLQVPEHFANEPGKPMVLHHPRPHSRGHSLTQNLLQDDPYQGGVSENNAKPFAPLNGIPEAQKGDDMYEIETNPSNLGTPVQNYDFSTPFGQHQKNASNVSNPWNDAGSAASQQAHSRHGSKPSLSKLNVQAPEFKFNPTSNFTPGQFSFSGSSFQPTAFQAATEEPRPVNEVPEFTPQQTVPSFGGSSKPENNFPSFAPGKSEFSFSTLGPKFRPDAPSFTPFQAVTSPPPSGNKHAPRESIFGNIRINTDEIVKPNKKSKAIPIIRPSSRESANSGQISTIVDEDLNEDARLPVEESRAKRAKSQNPDDDDVPLFAEQPKEATPMTDEEKTQPIEEPEATDEAENALPADTSMSSAITSEQVDTKATTAAPSETSPAEGNVNNWAPFDFDSQFDARNFSEARPSGEDIFMETKHKPSLSATAQPFVPVSNDDQKHVSEEPAESAEPAGTPEPVQDRPASPTPKPKSAPKGTGLGASRFASPPPKPKGLAASRFAAEPSPEPSPEPVEEPTKDEVVESIEKEPQPESVSPVEQSDDAPRPSIEGIEGREPTFEDIDNVMQHLEKEPSLGINKTSDPPSRPAPRADVAKSPTYKLEPPTDKLARDSPVEREYKELPEPKLPVLEDPFVESHPRSPDTEEVEEPRSPIASDWDAAFSADEHDKLESRAQFFDGRVNEVVGNLLASRLEPLEQVLFSIQDALALKATRPASSRHDMRSLSAERQESDADDEDDEPAPRRSLSPRRDRKMEHIRAAVLEGLAAHHRSQPAPVSADADKEDSEEREVALFKALAEMKEHMVNNVKSDFGGDELKNLIEDAVQSRMPPPPEPDADLVKKVEGLQSKIEMLEERLQAEQSRAEQEITARRTAEDTSADLSRQLQAAETRVEVEIINRSVFDQRVTDLEEKLRHQEGLTEEEVQNRRKAEDRLSEVQRLLRISSEEETRLRELAEEKDTKIKSMEQANGKTSMKMALLEASQTNSTQSQTELTNKLNALEADLKNVRQDNNHWRTEAERADEAARRKSGELAYVLDENKHMQKSLSTLTMQLEENERLRENWRAKFLALQEDMGKAAREIAEENARRIKKDQALLARQEVLDARLQAEAKTRERLEVELDRLQTNERTGMRATKECERLEGLLGELRTENHRLEQRALAAQREFEEARESGASEVKRTRMSMQTELDSANHQVNAIREELEEQNNKLRAELDNFKLEADTIKARNEMLLEEAETTKTTEIEELKQKHQNELEDMQTRFEQQRSIAVDESQRTEQSLLERLSFSASKIEHLQDRILHLEEKLEISKEAAAAAAAAAAKTANVEAKASTPTSPVGQRKPSTAAKVDVPEKISPQALRESIMVLQEQLQAREQRIEELEQTVAKFDPDAASKISKRDDEITWLRELLAVRQGDLQDIIQALATDAFDRERVKDAAIRLKANLQMEEQERERAMNGGSAISLPNIAQSIQTATPKVAQTIGAAWGNWRKGSGSFGSIGSRLNSPAAARNATPSKINSAPQNRNLGGLLTPPASGVRQNPLMDNRPQPTAFGSTGRRYPSQGSSSNVGRERGASNTSRRSEKMPVEEPASPGFQEQAEPMTPPMMRPAVYDSDAQPGDFDDDGFFEDD